MTPARFRRLGKWFLGTSLLASFMACSSGRQTSTTIQTGAGTITSLPTTTSTTTFPITSSATTTTGTIFDQTVGNRETPQTGTAISNTMPNSQFSACLNAGNQTSSYCFQQAFGFDPSIALTQGSLMSFQRINDCVAAVLQRAPADNATNQEVQQAFLEAKLGLTRCIRNGLQWQAGYLPWAQQPLQAFQANDQILFQILLQLARRQ